MSNKQIQQILFDYFCIYSSERGDKKCEKRPWGSCYLYKIIRYNYHLDDIYFVIDLILVKCTMYMIFRYCQFHEIKWNWQIFIFLLFDFYHICIEQCNIVANFNTKITMSYFCPHNYSKSWTLSLFIYYVCKKI